MRGPRSSCPATRRIAVVAVVLAALAATACRPPAELGPRRIVLFSMDTVRADAVASGAGGPGLPHLTKLAGEGVVFPRFYAASNYTLPSHMSIFTGLDPVAHGVLIGAARLAPQVPTLPELLTQAGYRAWSFNESGYVAARYGFDRGFEAYRELPPGAVVGDALPEVLDWVRAQADEPYFLFLHTYAAHFPYGGYADYRARHPDRGLLSDEEIAALRARAPGGSKRQGRAHPGFDAEERAQCTLYNQLAEHYADLLACGANWLPENFESSPHYEPRDLEAIQRSYAARIARIDSALGALRDELVSLGQWDDTLLVVTSDHGEGFFEHGLYMHDFSPFDEVLRVPLLIVHPRGLADRAGERNDSPGWHPDLMPTVLARAGVRVPDGIAGRDLLAGAGPPRDRALHPTVMSAPNRARKPNKRVLVRDGRKWIEGYRMFGDRDGLLFDLEADPHELSNLREREAEAFSEMAARSHAWGASLERHDPVNADTGEVIELGGAIPAPRLSEEERALLEGLGYVE